MKWEKQLFHYIVLDRTNIKGRWNIKSFCCNCDEFHVTPRYAMWEIYWYIDICVGWSVDVLSSVHHRNLVELVGFCDDKDKRMLVYEYLPEGSSRDRLNGTIFTIPIWTLRKPSNFQIFQFKTPVYMLYTSVKLPSHEASSIPSKRTIFHETVMYAKASEQLGVLDFKARLSVALNAWFQGPPSSNSDPLISCFWCFAWVDSRPFSYVLCLMSDSIISSFADLYPTLKAIKVQGGTHM